jgi:hypothetical protein
MIWKLSISDIQPPCAMFIAGKARPFSAVRVMASKTRKAVDQAKLFGMRAACSSPGRAWRIGIERTIGSWSLRSYVCTGDGVAHWVIQVPSLAPESGLLEEDVGVRR